MAMTAGTNHPEMASARRWMGALDAWACSTRRMIWASMVSRPTLVARKRKAPVWLTVAPMTVSPVDLVGHGLAGDHRLVDRRAALQHLAVDRDLLAGTDHEDLAHGDLLDGDVGLLATAQHPAGAGLEAERMRIASLVPA